MVEFTVGAVCCCCFHARGAFIFVAFCWDIKKVGRSQLTMTHTHTHTRSYARTLMHWVARQREEWTGREYADANMWICGVANEVATKMRMCGEQGQQRSTSSNVVGDTDCRFVVSPTNLCGDCDAGSAAGRERATNAATPTPTHRLTDTNTQTHTHTRGGWHLALSRSLSRSLLRPLSFTLSLLHLEECERARYWNWPSSHCRRWVIRHSPECEREIRPHLSPSRSPSRQSSARQE